MAQIRMGRIEEEIKKIISSIILNDLKDPRISGLLSVTGVEVSNDLKYANIYISIYDEKEKCESSIKALNNTKGFIRKQLASRIKLRYTPELNFKLDTSIQYGNHIDEILNQIINKDEE